MAISVTNAYEKTNSTNIPAYNSGGGNYRCLVVVHVCFDASPTGISYGGSAMTLADSQLDADSWGKTYLYYLMNPPAGSNTFSISGGSTNREPIFVVTLTGVDTSGVGNKNKASGNSTTASTSVTPTASGNLIIFGVSSGTNSAMSASGGSTLINEASNNNGEGGMFSIATTGTGSHTCQATVPSDYWTIVAGEFRAADLSSMAGQFFQFF